MFNNAKNDQSANKRLICVMPRIARFPKRQIIRFEQEQQKWWQFKILNIPYLF